MYQFPLALSTVSLGSGRVPENTCEIFGKTVPPIEIRLAGALREATRRVLLFRTGATQFPRDTRIAFSLINARRAYTCDRRTHGDTVRARVLPGEHRRIALRWSNAHSVSDSRERTKSPSQAPSATRETRRSPRPRHHGRLANCHFDKPRRYRRCHNVSCSQNSARLDKYRSCIPMALAGARKLASL